VLAVTPALSASVLMPQPSAARAIFDWVRVTILVNQTNIGLRQAAQKD
jgi:hypothetical protein